jgi:hypothetical protein
LERSTTWASSGVLMLAWLVKGLVGQGAMIVGSARASRDHAMGWPVDEHLMLT